MRSFIIASLVVASSTAAAAPASDNLVAAAEPAAAEPVITATAPAPTGPAVSGSRLRNGFSLSLGQEMGSGPSSGLSGQLYGIDWRIGMAMSDRVAVYADTHLSMGTAKIGAASGATGNFAAALIGEYTLPMRVFVGGGAGYGVLNNPSGPLLQLRAGWYPFETTSRGKARRLNIALDSRFYFAGEQVGTVSHFALSLGYDRF